MAVTDVPSSVPLVPAARFSPYWVLLWPNWQPLSRSEFAQPWATCSSFGDHVSGPAQ
jgi:hypothetical protein